MRGAGLPSTADHGRRRPVDGVVGVTAYRIVQEALTNVLRHAAGRRPGRPDFDDEALVVTVATTAATARGDRPGHRGGQGLVGMRERVAVLGGTPRRRPPGPDGGFPVEARLPLRSIGAVTEPVIRVVVADDQELVRSGFAMILDAQPDIEVVGEAADGEEAVAVARRAARRRADGRPHAPRRRHRGHPPLAGPGRADPVKVVILTTFDLDEYVFEAPAGRGQRLPAQGRRREDLVHAVRVVAAGDALLAPP